MGYFAHVSLVGYRLGSCKSNNERLLRVRIEWPYRFSPTVTADRYGGKTRMKSKFVVRFTENLFLGKQDRPTEYSRCRSFPTFQSAQNELSTLKSLNPDNTQIQGGRICQMF